MASEDISVGDVVRDSYRCQVGEVIQVHEPKGMLKIQRASGTPWWAYRAYCYPASAADLRALDTARLLQTKKALLAQEEQ